jgi:hypothetical protein
MIDDLGLMNDGGCKLGGLSGLANNFILSGLIDMSVGRWN